ncbi:MAG TPA: hypothetical protein VNO14_07470, partial [Blastocatellia bacterium]|nr:hypothetical protein [Blastocatellia bacterium]
MWVLTGIQGRLPQVEPLEVASPAAVEQAYESAPRGLSRQREDFDKALSIIADAASSDEQLMGYFARVQKRIRGEATPPEPGSGVHVIEPVRKRDQKVEMERLSAAESSGATSGQTGASKALTAVKGFIGGPMKDSPPAAASPAPHIEANREPATRLTVGDLEFEMNPAIERWINYYTTTLRGRQTMQIGINRSSSYIDLSRTEFQRLGVPEDLVWLAHVESVWHKEAVSPASAGGLWQF